MSDASLSNPRIYYELLAHQVGFSARSTIGQMTDCFNRNLISRSGFTNRPPVVSLDQSRSIMSFPSRVELSPAVDFHVHLRDGAMMKTVVPTIKEGGVDTVYVMVCTP